MIEIVEAVSPKQQKDFLTFPDRLYKGNNCYVPPLYLDEKKIFRKDYVYYDTCEAVYFNAYRDGEMVGRISGIIQRASNEKRNEKRARFIRFDVIEDFDVAKALFERVEKWALSRGMDTICGPLGFSDLEREGLLVEGFDQMNTFEEQYNAPYYQDFIERLGYQKEVDWLEYRIFGADPDKEEEMQKMSDFVLRRYKLHFGESRTVKEFLAKYKDGFFEILDKSYANIYGTVPFTPGMKKLMIDNFKLIIDVNHVAVIVDENDKVVLMAICFPSIAKAMQISGGHLTIKSISRFLKDRRHPEVIDLGLIGVDPLWQNRGVSACVAAALSKMLKDPGVQYAESNLNMEDNYAIQNLWKRFNAVQHKRRRAYVKWLR